MADATHLEMKDWAEFQHYRDRRPPWIKLYATLLTNMDFLEMPEAAQAQLIKLWVLASQLGHPLPNKPRFLAGKIGTSGRFHLQHMIAKGFVVPCYQDASTPLAEPEQNARPLSTEVREQRVETSLQPTARVWQPSRETQFAERLTTDVGRQALAVLLQASGQKAAILGEIEACMDGLRGEVHKATGGEMDVALNDYVANEFHKDNKWNGTLFRGVVRRAIVACRADIPVRQNGAAAGEYVAKIRKLIKQNPGHGHYLPKPEVAALGDEVLRAYESVGGAERFLNVTVKDLPFLIRDFGVAMRGTQ